MAQKFPDLKHNFAATTAPGATNDSASGYDLGSRWVDVLTGTEYRCIDATASAARWAIDPYAGMQSVAGLLAAVGGRAARTATRLYLHENFSKRPFLAADVTFLTDSSGGTASASTLADQNDAVTGVDGTGSNAASKADVDTRLGTIADNVATLALKLKNVMQANEDWEVAGTNMTSALVTIGATTGGLILTSAGANNDQCILQPRLTNANDSRWAKGFVTDQKPALSFSIRLPAITNISVKVALALTNAHNLTTDADQVGFFFTSATDTTWRCIRSIGGTDTEDDSGVDVAADTEYRFDIVIDANRLATYYINGVKVAVSPALTTATNLIPFVSIQALTGAAKVIHVRPVDASMEQAA